MTLAISGTTGITLATQFDSASTFGYRNRIINGGMVIDQRNAGASVTPINLQYTLDRWGSFVGAASKFTIQQNAGSVTPPVGFINYLGATSTSAYSVAATDVFGIYQFIEGYNTADLAWGTANAKAVTLSFQVYSSLTGNFGGTIRNNANTRSYPFLFNVPTANTWTTISVTIPGDTSGTWLTNSSSGVKITFSLGTGSTYSGTASAWAAAEYYSATGAVSVVGTNGATFYITGVQLEKGSTATSFDFRSYGTELALCQRYLPAFNGASNWFSGQAVSTTVTYTQIVFPVTTRVAPTGITTSTISSTNFLTYNSSGSGLNVTALAYVFASPYNALITTTVASGLVAGNAASTSTSISSAQILFTGCEL